MLLSTIFASLILFTAVMCMPQQQCISKVQQWEVPHCCQMEQLIPRHVRTKCQEKAAVHHNPGFMAYEVCQAHCLFEELEVIDGEEVHLDKLYPLAEQFPVDYRQAVRRAIDECDERLKNSKQEKLADGKQCPMLGSKLENCLNKATFNNCPNSRWRASITCNKVREGLEFC